MATTKSYMFEGPTQASHFRLITVKSRLKLEKQGLKHSSGALRPRIAAEFGLKPRDSYDKFICAVQAAIDKSAASMQDNIAIGG